MPLTGKRFSRTLPVQDGRGCHPERVADKAAGRVSGRAKGLVQPFYAHEKLHNATIGGRHCHRSDGPRNVKQQSGWHDFLFRVAHVMMPGVDWF